MLKINRSSDRDAAKSIVEGIKFMKEGNGIILFPEGGIKTREVEQMVSIKPGAYKLATKSEAIICLIFFSRVRFSYPRNRACREGRTYFSCTPQRRAGRRD